MVVVSGYPDLVEMTRVIIKGFVLTKAACMRSRTNI